MIFMRTQGPSPNRARWPTRTAGILLALGLSPAVLVSCADTMDQGDDHALEARLAMLESKEEIRSVLLEFSQIVDESDPAALLTLEPRLHDSFVMRVVDFDGAEYRFEGLEGVVEGFGPIMRSAQANLAPSAIAVDIDGNHATASFKFVNSVVPPPQLGLDVGEKVLLLAANTVMFVREDGIWKLVSLELVHSLAYPGTIPGLGD